MAMVCVNFYETTFKVLSLAPQEHTATMDRFSGSGRTDSTIDDSPFGSTLNTPADEDVREPFEAIGQRLKELQAHRAVNNLEKQYKQMDNLGTCEVLAPEVRNSFLHPLRINMIGIGFFAARLS